MNTRNTNAVRGFVLRSGEDGLAIVRATLGFYDRAAQQGFVALRLPLAHPTDTFVGPPPRPIRPKYAARVLRSLTPEGESVAMRYEGTAPSARYIAARSHEPEFAGARVAYFDEMYRLEMEEELDDRHLRAHEEHIGRLILRPPPFVGRAVFGQPQPLRLRERAFARDVFPERQRRRMRMAQRLSDDDAPQRQYRRAVDLHHAHGWRDTGGRGKRCDGIRPVILQAPPSPLPLMQQPQSAPRQ